VSAHLSTSHAPVFSDRIASKSGRGVALRFHKGDKKMAVTYKVVQQHTGGNHGAIFIEDIVSQRRLGTAVYDPARNQFAFSSDNNDLVLSSADQTAIVAILNSLSR
jgi:hypothetical protein